MIVRWGDDPANWFVADADAHVSADPLVRAYRGSSRRLSIPPSLNATISWPKSRL
jgi:hypothetical protein